MVWGTLLTTSCKTNVHLVQTKVLNQKTTDESTADKEVEAMIQPYRVKMEKEMNVVIGQLGQDIIKEQPESTMGNFVADLVYDMCQKNFDNPIDFAVVNYGGLRVPSMLAGDVTKGSIFELMPFDNMLVVMDLDGPTTLQLFNSMAAYGGWPISDQARFKIVEGAAKEITVGGEAFDIGRNYKVAISDYIANGGDKLSYLKDKPRVNLGLLFRDAILTYVEDQKGKTMMVELDGRVRE